MVLPREIMFEILKEVPVKSLLRLRCVSMLWLSVIDDPLFVELHRTRSQSRSGGIRLLVSEPQEDVCLIKDEFPGCDSSSDGLVCFEKSHRLLNPSTRECIDLPPLPAHVPTGSADISMQRHYLFPVFDHSTKTYKVLSASKQESNVFVRNIDFRILSLGASTSTSTSWREIDFPLKCFDLWIQDICCVYNVVYFWVNILDDDSPVNQVIFAFDVATEIFLAVFRCPSGEGPFRPYMVQVGQKLAVQIIDFRGTTAFIKILEDYQKDGLNLELGGRIKEANWKKVRLNFPYEWGIGLRNRGNYVSPLGKFHTNKILFRVRSWYDLTILFYFYYDLESETCVTVFKLEDFGIHHSKSSWITTYVETLYRLKL